MLNYPENNFKMIAKTFQGLENVLVTELKELGARDIETKIRAVSFYGDYELLYKDLNHMFGSSLKNRP